MLEAKRIARFLLSGLVIAFSQSVATPWASSDELPAKVTFDEHIKPIFRDHCVSCHNANEKKSGLALDNFSSTMSGGSSGESLEAGDLQSSRLWMLTSHAEQPKMPPDQDRIPDAKLELLKKWIEQGMPENSGSAVMKPKVDLTAMGAVSQARPEGAPPMPESVLLQTPLYTPRAAAISALAASPWSPLIAVGGQEQVVLYHSQNGELLGILPFPEGEPQSITFSRDGKLILVGGGRHSHSGYAVLYDIQTGKRITRVGDELDIAMGADLSEDNSLIAIGGPQKMVRIYETESGKLLHDLKKHTDWIYAVRFSPDGRLVATADRSNGLILWEAETGRLFLDLIGHKGEIRSLAWRPDSQALISGSMDGTIKVWSTRDGKMITSWDAHPGGVTAVASCNDGTIASTGSDKKVRVWEVGGKSLGEIAVLPEVGMEVAISVDSKEVAAGDWQGNVRIWQRDNPKVVRSVAANPPTLQQMIAESEKGWAAGRQATEAAEKVLQGIRSRHQKQQETFAALEKAAAAAAKATADQKAKIALLKKDLEGKLGEIASTQTNLEKSREQLQQLMNQYAIQKAKQADLAKIESELSSHRDRVENQEKAAILSRTKVMEFKSLIAVEESTEKELLALQSKKEKERNDAQAALGEIAKELAAKTQEFETSNAQVAKLAAQLESRKQALARFEATRSQWQQRRDELMKAGLGLEQQQSAILSEQEAATAKHQAIVKQIEERQKQLAQLQKLLKQAELQRETSAKGMEAQQTRLDEIVRQLGESKLELDLVKGQLDAYRSAP